MFSVHINPGKFENDTHFSTFLKSTVFGDQKRRFSLDGWPIRVKKMRFKFTRVSVARA